MSKKCKAYSVSKLGLEPADNRKAFYAGWNAALAEQPAQQRPQNCGTGYCSCIECPYEQPAQQPVAMRYDFDGYGYKYIDAGSGSDWQTRIKDAEPVYASPQPAQQWVDLTDPEIAKLSVLYRHSPAALIVATQDMLRFKNKGG